MNTEKSGYIDKIYCVVYEKNYLTYFNDGKIPNIYSRVFLNLSSAKAFITRCDKSHNHFKVLELRNYVLEKNGKN